jgi:hypothetical protein
MDVFTACLKQEATSLYPDFRGKPRRITCKDQNGQTPESVPQKKKTIALSITKKNAGQPGAFPRFY